MAATFLHDGKAIDYTPGSAVAVGDVVELGSDDFVGICTNAIAANALGALMVEGVFVVPKTTASDDIAAGARLAFASGAVAVSATGKHVAVKAAGVGVTTI